MYKTAFLGKPYAIDVCVKTGYNEFDEALTDDLVDVLEELRNYGVFSVKDAYESCIKELSEVYNKFQNVKATETTRIVIKDAVRRTLINCIEEDAREKHERFRKAMNGEVDE